MSVSRTLAMGDIHGCLDKLVKLMQAINWRPAHDTLIFIGDYIDRGPDSAGVIEYLIGLKDRSDRLIFLTGNHEQMLLDFLEGRNSQLFFANGGYETLASYGGSEKNIPAAHHDFIHSLRSYYETEEYIFVHAGLRDGIPLKEQSLNDLVWIREEFILSNYDHGKRVVFGHTPLGAPLVRDNKIGIDTGAVYGGLLTCVELPDLIFYSV